jgi:hypothetical protein
MTQELDEGKSSYQGRSLKRRVHYKEKSVPKLRDHSTLWQRASQKKHKRLEVSQATKDQT